MTRTQHTPPKEKTSDLLWTAEQLYSDLLNAGLLVPAASVFDAVTDLRVKVREETGE